MGRSLGTFCKYSWGRREEGELQRCLASSVLPGSKVGCGGAVQGPRKEKRTTIQEAGLGNNFPKQLQVFVKDL